ncbi:MAG: nucleotidyltransferase domain-containing protein [Desulfuromusa sp.]
MLKKDKIIRVLMELLCDKADFALLFGSWAKDEARITRESDVDCGVFFYPEIVADKSYFDIAEQFEFIVGRKLDIVCLNTADIIIASQIIATGEEIFTQSKKQLDAYRAYVMSRYLDFKQSRKIIEDNILVRPKYGQ